MIMQYGLIGEKLGHSFSKIIHEKLADYTYDLHPLPKQELASFLEKKRISCYQCNNTLQNICYALFI